MTGRFWLGDGGRLETAAPNLAAPVRLQAPTDYFAGGAMWTRSMEADGRFWNGSARFWIEITDPILNDPRPNQFGNVCTWSWSFGGGWPGNGTDWLESEDAFCIVEPDLVLMPAIRPIDFSFRLPAAVVPGGLHVTPGLRIGTTFVNYAQSVTSGSVWILAGTAEYDSWIELEGLEEPAAV